VKHGDPACGGGIDGNDAPMVGMVRGIVWPCGDRKRRIWSVAKGLRIEFSLLTCMRCRLSIEVI
jgi:hypothetical protein